MPTRRKGFGTTEAQARKVAQQIEKTRGKRKVAPKKRYLDPTKPTARNPPGIGTSPARAQQQLEAIRKKRAQRIAASKKKAAKKKRR